MISEPFEKICKVKPPNDFGEPFASAFKALYDGEEDDIQTAAYICSIFLSAIKRGFPTEKLRIFVHYVQENHKRFSFDCRMYDTIVEQIDSKSLKKILLLDRNYKVAETECNINDIKEALDFYTNR